MSKNYYRPTNNIQGQRTSANPIDEASKLSETDKEIDMKQSVVESEILESEPEAEPIIGVVTDCLKLRVRKQPNMAAEVVCEIDALAEVQIDENDSTDEFYKVTTSVGVEGFCMKKFIAVKR